MHPMTSRIAAADPDRLAVDPSAGSAAMNRLAAAGEPFFFLIDAWAERWVVRRVGEAAAAGWSWSLEGRGVLGPPDPPPAYRRFTAYPVSLRRYEKAFRRVREAQVAGETWLANLTFPSRLDTDLELDAILRSARAPFRLGIPGRLAVFSPERFVRISADGRMASHPMKGTIDADSPNAVERILADEKERAEHVTIVDLIRNDLGMVARRVSVPRYRYLSEVRARGRRLLQVSSEVRAELGADWRPRAGDIFRTLLPAGSVTGAPKKRTGEILRAAEDYERGWYTGVFGAFDGRCLDSAVAIRFIEAAPDGSLVYKSGGGITINSSMNAEFAELEAKIYVPFG